MMIDAVLDDVDALLLDWDGTVADTTTSNYQVLAGVLAEYGLTMDREWYDARIGLALADLLDRFAEMRQQFVSVTTIISKCRAIRINAATPVIPIAAVVELLHAARRLDLPCAIASGSFRRIVDSGIRSLHLEGAFQAVVTREDVSFGKPAPDLFLAAAEAVGARPSRCVAVDDAVEGTAAAYAAGICRVLTLRQGRLHLCDAPMMELSTRDD